LKGTDYVDKVSGKGGIVLRLSMKERLYGQRLLERKDCIDECYLKERIVQATADERMDCQAECILKRCIA
jgi:hypothetical protein